MKIGTDCSGIEAPIQAIKRLGIDFEHIFSSDIDKHVKDVSDKIYKPGIFYPDLMARDNTKAPKADLYVAGFPCQAFSIAGKRSGFDDVRGTVFFGCADYIKQQQPEVFILENVKGLLSHDSGKTHNTIIELLSGNGGTVNGQMGIPYYDDGLGYHVWQKVLNTKDFGVPQNRERWFCVGFKKPREYRFPKPFRLETRLKDLLEPEVDEKYYLSEKMIKSLSTPHPSFNGRFEHNDGSDNANCLTSRYYKMAPTDTYITTHSLQPRSGNPKQGGTGHLSKDDGTSYCLDTGNSQAIELKQIAHTGETSQQAGRIYNDAVTPCLTAQPKRGSSKHSTWHKFGDKIRRLTPLECLRLQDFPDTFYHELKEIGLSDTQIYKMAGNSMSVNVMERLIKSTL